jgi:hypothetical protein
MKMDSTDRALVFVELFDHRVQSVVPQLDGSSVETGEDPWPFGVEGQAFHPGGFAFEFRQHFSVAAELLAVISPKAQFPSNRGGIQ